MKEETIRELQWAGIGYAAVAGAALLIALALWLSVPALRRRLFPLPRLRPGDWTGHEVFLAFCVFMGFPDLVTSLLYMIGFFAPLLGPSPPIEPPDGAIRNYLFRCDVIATPLSLTVTLASLFGIVYIRSGARPRQYGLTPARWQSNLLLGLAAFILATPLVMGLHLVATLALPERPNARMEFFKGLAQDWEGVFLALKLVVAAPLLEEIVFRGLLMGWLRRATLAGHLAVMTAAVVVTAGYGVYYTDPETKKGLFDPLPLGVLVVFLAGYAWQLYTLARRFNLREEEILHWRPELEDFDSIQAWQQANAKLAIYGSAMLFAFCHAAAWPAPLPLFAMALVLGALAQRTQSLVGPIAFHACFNLANAIGLFGNVMSS